MNTNTQSSLWLDIPNACSPADGICSGGRPQSKQICLAKSKGVRTVINLCPPTEASDYDEGALVESLGMNYVNIPVAGPADLTRDKAQRLADAIAGCGPDHPALLHCASGNRVGALLALKAFWIDRLAATDALAVGRKSGLTMLEPVVKQLLGL